MRLDIGAQRKVDVHGLLDAVVHHAKPIRGGLFQLCHAQQVAGLNDNLESIAEFVGKFADLDCNIFGDGVGVGRRSYRSFYLVSHKLKKECLLKLDERTADKFTGIGTELTADAAFVTLKTRG
jgi:hypothetical protein